ncbi:MarR family winged helix-turn-helix transcriptional regulator [Noviherbaspirillum saxi]|uniref:MarR family transcriptional regulator n=1 Tax=Noviherbaspirillum saxi TaxID=2320863 RepID=A0A3A3FJN8_9BURK|nr:MarR family transcriptional regulator [Noviherbaspirillum saxi]RJF91692.1 MarR family transcriptional regulator [Noviherbaspirillum saxi]
MQKKFHTEAGGAVEVLVDEVLRLRGRILSASRELNETRGLQSHSEGLLLTAVVRAAEPPTVAKIARSLGLTRQSVQRTANELAERGLVSFEDNPHHKRAKQLVATEAGLAAHALNADSRGQWTDRIGAAIGRDEVEHAVAVLRRIRQYLEHPEAVDAEFADLHPRMNKAKK